MSASLPPMIRPDFERRGLWQRMFEPPAIGQMAPITSIIVYTLLAFWTLFVVFPIYWIVTTSFKLPQHVNEGPVYIPFVDFQPSLHAWEALLVTDFGDTLGSFTNSVIVAFFSTALCVAIGSMAAYALARIQYKPKFGIILMFVALIAIAMVTTVMSGISWWIVFAVALALFVLLAKALTKRFTRTLGNGDILFWIISQRILPPVVVIIPIYMMFQSVGLIDTHLGLILAYAVANLPIVVWLMHDFFVSIPIEMEESAQLDGATRFYIFWDIVLPLTRPGLAATTLLTMILCWNEYLLAVFLSTSKAQTMPILVAAMNAGDRGILWWTMCVVIVVMIVPVILLAIVLQRFIAKGVLTGAVKG
jgi:multiple sugar transport system permease protein